MRLEFASDPDIRVPRPPQDERQRDGPTGAAERRRHAVDQAVRTRGLAIAGTNEDLGRQTLESSLRQSRTRGDWASSKTLERLTRPRSNSSRANPELPPN